MPQDQSEVNRYSHTLRPELGDWEKATEHLWRTLQSINEWTRFADAKAGAVLTANGVLGTLAAGLLKDNKKYVLGHYAIEAVAIFGGLALLVSSFFCAKCLLPKTKIKGGTRSLIFFDHIASWDRAKYLESADGFGDDDKVFQEVAGQVWANAKVSREKHQEVYVAIWLAGESLVCAMIVWIATFLAP